MDITFVLDQVHGAAYLADCGAGHIMVAARVKQDAVLGDVDHQLDFIRSLHHVAAGQEHFVYIECSIY
jgi:hypothetical protein